jgi:hypothetical protein
MTASQTWIVVWTLFCQVQSGYGITLCVSAPGTATVKSLVTATSIDIGQGSQASALEVTGNGSANPTTIGTTFTGTQAIITVTAYIVGDGATAGNISVGFAEANASGGSVKIQTPSTVQATHL